MGRTKELLGEWCTVRYVHPRRTLQELLDEVELLRQHDLKIAEEVAAREQELEKQKDQEEEQ